MHNQPIWHAPVGTVAGWHDGPVDRATGIRYARADRLEAPTPVGDATEPIQATSWSPACPQAPVPLLDDAVGSSIGKLPVDEDCMRLSITVPAGTEPDANLPVMVWIHGDRTCPAQVTHRSTTRARWWLSRTWWSST